jgi:dipeptidyl aminopeptidase/acylaminoacyl peptidase
MRKANPSEVLFNEIFIVDIASGVTRQLTHDRRTFYHPAWAPSGASIICAAVDGSMVSFDARASDLLSVDAATGVQRVLVGGAGIKFQPRWSPSGSKLAFESRTGLFEPPHLVVIDPTHGGAPATGPQLDRSIFDYEWSMAKAGFIVSYKDGVTSRLARVRLDSADVVDLTPRGELPYGVTAFSQSSSGAIAWRQTDPQDLVSVQFLSAEGARQKMLWKLRPNSNLPLGRAEIVTWRNSRGEEMEGTVLLPPGHREGERHPLIVDAYPGVGGTDWTSSIGGNYAWASMGYVVFRPAPPAPHTWMNPWKGYESSRAARGAEGWKVTFDDVMSGVDALITRGIVDGDRMCLFGHSNGIPAHCRCVPKDWWCQRAGLYRRARTVGEVQVVIRLQ